MALLARVLAAATLLAGCYSPDLRDCTVSCASSADCAGAQLCNAEHLCAAKDVSCSTMTTPRDASPGAADAPAQRDAAMIDAGRPPIDAPVTVIVHLHVDGHGQLSTDTTNCQNDCDVSVTRGTPMNVLAQGLGDQVFKGWTQGPCVGSQLPSCALAPTANVTVGARFHKED